MTQDLQAKKRGAIYGLAFGDAWGYPIEFSDYEQVRRYRPDFPKPALISDDTQMSIYVLNAALQDLSFEHSNILQMQTASTEFNMNEVRIQFAHALQQWLFDPDNNRAPGMTCINALMALEDRYLITGLEGTIEGSKGNGANIRCPWLGLLDLPDRTIENLAVLQSSVTHNHPLALASAAVTSLIAKALLEDRVQPGENHLYDYTVDLTEKLLHGLPDSNLGTNYSQGLSDLLAFLTGKRADVHAFHEANDLEDLCDFAGPGWVAEEALLAAVIATDHYHTLPMAGLRRLAQTSGDSDSMAAIGGAFLGAYAGDREWPIEWFGYLEPRYKQELRDVIDRLG